MTILEIHLGDPPHIPDDALRIQFGPDFEGDKSWTVEQEIERLEYGTSLNHQTLLLPASSDLVDGLGQAESKHLELFLHLRGAGSIDREEMRSLDKVPRPNDLPILFPSLIGSHEPRALLLGDRHNPNWNHAYKSAFGPWGGCGITMLESLTSEEWASLAMCNAYEEDLLVLWSRLGNIPVVSLGRAAQNLCRELEIPCGVVPHPQYFRRFLIKQGAPAYGRLIQEVIETQADRGAWRG